MLERIKESIKKFKETRFGKLYDTYGYLLLFMLSLIMNFVVNILEEQ